MAFRDVSSCGIFGILRKPHADKIDGKLVTAAIDLVRFRGSRYGAGYAVFTLDTDLPENVYRIGLFLIKDGSEQHRLDIILKILSKDFSVLSVEKRIETEKVLDYEIKVFSQDPYKLDDAVFNINDILWSDNRSGRIYYWGRHVRVFKGVGYPLDISKLYSVEYFSGDLWIAHTRQPTNSPGYYPYWSHPFSAHDIAIVHNGDISSFGSNMNYLYYYSSARSFVGTDSECIAFLLYKMIRIDRLLPDVASRLLVGDREVPKDLRLKYAGVVLDGPFAVAVGLYLDDDLYLIAMVDRQKLRPIVVGEDDNYYYVASEECQIRMINPEAKVWELEPGSFFIASYKRGVIAYGRTSIDLELFYESTNIRVSQYLRRARQEVPKGDNVIDAWGLDYRTLNDKILEKALEGHRVIKVYNVYGQRYIGINLARYGIHNVKLELFGIPGNCLGNLNEDTEIIVYGSAEDDVGDTMHGGKIVIHGDARDVLGQAMQGGYIFVRGCAGTRVGILMREYRDKRPYLIVGGRVDDYLAEYMAGGVVMVLGIDAYLNNVTGIELAGRHVGTGMVGGRVYIRGKVSPHKIGLRPPKLEFTTFISALIEEGEVPPELVQDIEFGDIEALEEALAREGRDFALRLAKCLYESTHIIKTVREYRELYEYEIKELKPILEEFAKYFDLNENVIEGLLSCKYTVVTRATKR